MDRFKILFSLHLLVVQSLIHVRLFVTPRTSACQASLSFTISWSLLKLMSIESVMSFNHLESQNMSQCLQSCPSGMALLQFQVAVSSLEDFRTINSSLLNQFHKEQGSLPSTKETEQFGMWVQKQKLELVLTQ